MAVDGVAQRCYPFRSNERVAVQQNSIATPHRSPAQANISGGGEPFIHGPNIELNYTGRGYRLQTLDRYPIGGGIDNHEDFLAC